MSKNRALFRITICILVLSLNSLACRTLFPGPTPTATITPSATPPQPSLTIEASQTPLPTRTLLPIFIPTEPQEAQTVFVSLIDSYARVRTNENIVLTIAWIADSPELVDAFLQNADFVVRLNGEPLLHTNDYWSEAGSLGDYDRDGDEDFETGWGYPLGMLPSGRHTITWEMIFSPPTSDGLDMDNDGEPDMYEHDSGPELIIEVIGSP